MLPKGKRKEEREEEEKEGEMRQKSFLGRIDGDHPWMASLGAMLARHTADAVGDPHI